MPHRLTWLVVKITNQYLSNDKIYIPRNAHILVTPNDVYNCSASGIDLPYNCIKYRIGDGMWQPYDLWIPFADEGPVKFTLRVIDNAGNVGESTIDNLIVDLIPPLTKVIIPEGSSYDPGINQYTIPAQATISMNATDSGSVDARSGVKKTYYTINNQESIYTAPISIPAMSITKLSYYSVDQVGNQEPMHEITFYRQPAPPQIELTVNDTPAATVPTIYTHIGSSINFVTVDEIDSIVSIYVSKNGGIFEKFTGTLVLVEEAEITLAYYAENGLHLKSPVKETRLLVDGTAPVTDMFANHPLEYFNGKYYANSNFIYKFIAKDAGSGVAETVMTLDGTPYLSASLDISCMAAGEHTFTYYSKDKVGNIEVTKTMVIVTPSNLKMEMEAQDICINFQPSTDPVPAKCLIDNGECFGDRHGYTYGWNFSY